MLLGPGWTWPEKNLRKSVSWRVSQTKPEKKSEKPVRDTTKQEYDTYKKEFDDKTRTY